MKIAVRLFVSSMVFALAIAGAYVWATHDVVGTILLMTMAVAMIVMTAYILVAENEANLAGDASDAVPADFGGEELGVFSLESYWPICGAAGTALLLMGTVFLPGPSAVTACIAAALLFFILRFLIQEST